MIVEIDRNNVLQAATVHSVSWKESHRSFCTADFIELHTPERQAKYLLEKMDSGSKFYMLIKDKPVGIVSINGNLIEDLYILPDKQGLGFGTELLQFAVGKCTDTPVLWILENNTNAERFYNKHGFKRTGRVSSVTDHLAEIELSKIFIQGGVTT